MNFITVEPLLALVMGIFILAVIHGYRDLASIEQKPWAVG